MTFPAKIGNREFDTPDALNKFVGSQVGYNTWITGKLKAMRPDLFNEDGSLKSAELEKAVADKGKKAEAAAETIKEISEIPEADRTDEQIEDIEKAKNILRPLGVVFADDPTFLAMKNKVGEEDEGRIKTAREKINEFETAHPMLKDHYTGVGELMKDRKYSLEKAWEVYKIENEIVEEEKPAAAADPKPADPAPAPKQEEDTTDPSKPLDKVLPASVKNQSGTAPVSGAGDFMDDILNLPGMR